MDTKNSSQNNIKKSEISIVRNSYISNSKIDNVTSMVDVVDSFLQGLDRPLVLYLIQKKPKHGYELMKEIKRLTGRRLKPSTLYPLLYYLESKGYVAGEWVEKGQRNLRQYSHHSRRQIASWQGLKPAK